MLTAFAPAKVNLYLHILNRRDDGYHELDSLVAFADVGDKLDLDISRPLSLEITGPFASACASVKDNSILKAAQALQTLMPQLRLGAFTLEKNLPVAAGLGGGTADAAAALRLLAKANNIPEDDNALKQAALQVGADVPVCLNSKPALMRGIGEIVERVSLPPLAAVLVNCGMPLATRDVFAKFSLRKKRVKENRESIPQHIDALVDFLKKQTNDLAEIARILCPDILKIEKALEGTGAVLVRLSGSGATVFALYERNEQAGSAAAKLRAENPGWWVKAVTLGSPVL